MARLTERPGFQLKRSKTRGGPTRSPVVSSTNRSTRPPIPLMRCSSSGSLGLWSVESGAADSPLPPPSARASTARLSPTHMVTRHRPATATAATVVPLTEQSTAERLTWESASRNAITAAASVASGSVLAALNSAARPLSDSDSLSWAWAATARPCGPWPSRTPNSANEPEPSAPERSTSWHSFFHPPRSCPASTVLALRTKPSQCDCTATRCSAAGCSPMAGALWRGWRSTLTRAARASSEKSPSSSPPLPFPPSSSPPSPGMVIERRRILVLNESSRRITLRRRARAARSSFVLESGSAENVDAGALWRGARAGGSGSAAAAACGVPPTLLRRRPCEGSDTTAALAGDSVFGRLVRRWRWLFPAAGALPAAADFCDAVRVTAPRSSTLLVPAAPRACCRRAIMSRIAASSELALEGGMAAPGGRDTLRGTGEARRDGRRL
mmetsp:Transcript_8967/g.31233  ORF Transcript_8967/g.31233 Transcript_8967/m.31233 type:complete len:442 (-) Transcript_8967:30-1355(-)